MRARQPFQTRTCTRLSYRILANWKILESFSLLVLVASCVTQTSSGLVVTAASPLADHWPVIVAGGRAGAPNSSIGVLCCCWYHGLQILCCRCVGIPSDPIAISLTLCDGLFLIAACGVISFKQDFKIMPHPGSNASDKSNKLVLEWYWYGNCEH